MRPANPKEQVEFDLDKMHELSDRLFSILEESDLRLLLATIGLAMKKGRKPAEVIADVERALSHGAAVCVILAAGNWIGEELLRRLNPDVTLRPKRNVGGSTKAPGFDSKA